MIEDLCMIYSVYHIKFAWLLYATYSGLFEFGLHMFKEKHLGRNLGLLNLPWVGRDRDSFQCETEGGFMCTVNDSLPCSQ